MKEIIICIILIFSYTCSYSQSKRGSEIGIIGGGAYYIGDLNNQKFINTPSVTGGVLYRYTLDERWVLKASALYGKLEQLEDIDPVRNLGFKSSLFEFSGQIEFNFLPFLSDQSYYISTPYIFCGIGIFRFNPKATLGDGKWHELRGYRTEGQDALQYPDRKMYSLLQLCIPFGIGFKWYVSKDICIGLEWGLRKTWTDYIDDVSTTYVDEEIIWRSGGDLGIDLADRGDPTYHSSNSQRGNPALKDWYGFMGATVTVKIQNIWKKNKCNN